MAKKTARKSAEPEAEIPTVAESEPEAGPVKAISKAAAVRDAVAQGEDSPEGGVKYIKKVHGLDISKQMFSSYKAQAKVRDARKAGDPEPTRKPKPATPAVEGFDAAPSAAGEPDLLLALESVKALVGQFGADRLKRMVDIVG